MIAVRTLIARILIATAGVAIGGAASAATYHATEVVQVQAGTGQTGAADRYVASNALGASDEEFYALGLGGQITLGFGTGFSGGQVTIKEVTYSSDGVNPPADRHFEAVDVYAINGMTTTFLGRLLNYGANTLNITGDFEYIRLVDATRAEFGRRTSSKDGFDIDSVAVAAVPLPAAGLMLLAGLTGFSALRRRKQKA